MRTYSFASFKLHNIPNLCQVCSNWASRGCGYEDHEWCCQAIKGWSWLLRNHMSPVGKNFGKLNLDLPCIAASVSKPEPYADKLGVNSVNTEFSFIGTHKSFKQRFGVQNSSKFVRAGAEA
ncbi:hypothetical protein ACFX2C_005723 [Malus domestica]